MSDEELTEEERLDREAQALAAADGDDAGGAEAEVPQEAPPGVLVVKQKDEQNNIHVDAVPVGGVEATEVLTLLELAIDAFRAKVGLRGR